MPKEKIKRLNIYFRQTAKAFRAAKQAQVFIHFNKNLPFRIYAFSKTMFRTKVLGAKSRVDKYRLKLPPKAKRVPETKE